MPNLGPSTTEQGYAVYQNRSAEIGWMIVRLLPFLQPYENAFGDEWTRKRKVLDNGFRFMSEQMASALQKRIGSSFVELMEKKFTFPDSLHYFESTHKPA
jgi:hypothetical protein